MSAASCQPVQPLREAILARDWSLAMRLATGEDRAALARAYDCDGWLPLHRAIERSAAPVLVSALLDAEPATVRARTEEGHLPVHVAAIYGAPPAVVHLLLRQYPVRAISLSRTRARA